MRWLLTVTFGSSNSGELPMFTPVTHTFRCKLEDSKWELLCVRKAAVRGLHVGKF